MKTLLAALLVASFPVYAEFTPEALERESRNCESFGFQRGTDGFAHCLQSRHDSLKAQQDHMRELEFAQRQQLLLQQMQPQGPGLFEQEYWRRRSR